MDILNYDTASEIKSNSLRSMYDDWPRKQASKRLLLVEGRGLLFTAIIISTLSGAVKGQLTV